MFLVLTDFNPIFGTVVRSLLFTLAGLVIIVFSCIVFNKAKLERSGDHIMSKRAEALVTAIVTFMGAILLGLIMGVAFNSTSGLVVGNILGAILTWFVMKVILVRTVRVFKKEHLLPLIVGAICAAIFVGAFVGDVFGFASKVPDKADVNGVSGNTPITVDDIRIYDERNEFINSNAYIEDKDYVSKVVDLHRYIVDNGLISKNSNGDIGVLFRYSLKNGKKLERLFYINPDDKAVELIQDIVNSDAYRDRLVLPEDLVERAKMAEINCSIYYNNGASPGDDFYMSVDDKDTIRRIIDTYNEMLRSKEFDASNFIPNVNYGSYGEDNMDEYVEPQYACWVDVGITYEAGAPGSQGDGYLEITLNSADNELAELFIELYNESKNNLHFGAFGV